ncbi:M-phase phosphoprotein 9 [Spea bombifrons]|uniref:M-phase phosphoprotein 9 n=1 Tax=Spea bombifrons TaxID=233779 RepID=UPI0023499EDD|nr:M-phase phosphoprotein 9 [Spea bombifrons]
MAGDNQVITYNKQEPGMDFSTSTKADPQVSEPPEGQRKTAASGERDVCNDAATAEMHSSPPDVRTLTTELCSAEYTDQKTWENCEDRWLKLFQLVEKQCQDQMAAQQEQFNSQIQVIRDEIKNFIQLRGGECLWKSCTGDAVLSMASNDPGGHGKRDASSSSFSLHGGLDRQQKAFLTQEHFQENTSLSSGYGTHSASEPSACLSAYSQNTSTGSRLPTASRTESVTHHTLIQAPLESERHFIHGSENTTEVITASENIVPCLPNEKNMASKNDRPNSKSLTTWAQKLKQNQQKKNNQMDLAAVHHSQANSQVQAEALTLDGTTDGPSNTFYLNKRTASSNSLVSAGSGFTYWLLDEKEMYHPLPDNFGTGLSKFFTNNEASETSIPSLTDLYKRKQKESSKFPGWEPVSPSEYTHPPEVLTLDPTLHRKPHRSPQFHTGRNPSGENSNVSLTPDSFLENAPFNHYDSTTVSTSASAPSLLAESLNSFPGSPLIDEQRWEIGRYQNRANHSLELSPRSGDERMLCTEDDVNSLTPSSMPQSPLPFTDETMSESNQVHPLTLSNIRRSLREKHARHISDLRDYYESEISNLKQQILANNSSIPTEEHKKITSLSERCAHMEGAVTEASKRIRILENKNNELETLLHEWRERCKTANDNAKVLQEQVEGMRTSNKEKENAISRLQSKLKELEEALEKAFRVSDDKGGRIKQEQKRFQDLLSEYQSLGKEHERVKDTLCSAENKLCEAHDENKELKRLILKLEAQIKQLEHENTVKLRHISESHLLQSSVKSEMVNAVHNLRSLDVAKRKCLAPGSECSMFTGQPLDNKNCDVENTKNNTYLPNRYSSPPDKNAPFDTFPGKAVGKDSESHKSPILKALKDFEEGKVIKSWGTPTEKQNAGFQLPGRRQTIGFNDSWSSFASPEKQKDGHRRMNSPSGPRSSSVPPSNRKPTPVTTPTKRELMIMPVCVKYSPKRSPRENLSPGFSQCNEENPMTRFGGAWDGPSTSKDPSPRKRLQFMSLDDPEGIQRSRSESQLPILVPPYETELTYNERVKNVADVERLFDDLTEEKQQIEAALSRMPGAGHRLSLQMRAKKEKLEDRLEKINRDLGSLRMTLKKHHILPTSANI